MITTLIKHVVYHLNCVRMAELDLLNLLNVNPKCRKNRFSCLGKRGAALAHTWQFWHSTGSNLKIITELIHIDQLCQVKTVPLPARKWPLNFVLFLFFRSFLLLTKIGLSHPPNTNFLTSSRHSSIMKFSVKQPPESYSKSSIPTFIRHFR